MWLLQRAQIPPFPRPLTRDPTVHVGDVGAVEWSWRPKFLRHPTPRLAPRLDTHMDLGEGASLQHSCDAAEGFMTRPFGVQPVPLRLDLFFFEGSDIWINLFLPEAVTQTFTRRHILAMNLDYWAERAVSLRCTVTFHAQNYSQSTEFECSTGSTFEIDLKELLGRKVSLSQVEVTLRIVQPQLTAFVLRDLSFMRYLRADL